MDFVASESSAFQNSSGQPVKTYTVEVVQEDPGRSISSSDRTGRVLSMPMLGTSHGILVFQGPLSKWRKS